MAFAQKRGEWYRVVFHYNGKRYRKCLKTQNEVAAEAVAGGVKRTLMMLEQGLLRIPAGANVVSFILSGGQEVKLPHASPIPKVEVATLGNLKTQYVDAISIGSMEENSLNTVKMHLKHFVGILGEDFELPGLKLSHLQGHVNTRAKAKGLHGHKLSATTIRKEIASFRAAWNWGVLAGLVTGSFPNKGLKFPKLDEKPPFQTWQEIERRIARGGLINGQVSEMWESLFLQKTEIEEMIGYIKGHARMPWLHPLVCTAAFTGARRSELVRIEIGDVDFELNTILIREKKRSREKRTTRRVTITPFLKQVLQDWLADHPGGQFLFTHRDHVFRSKKRSRTTGHLSEGTRPSSLKGRMQTVKKRQSPAHGALTRNEVHDHLKRSLADSKWKVLRGIHTLRHSYISCLASAGVDQRIIDELAGHQTPEQQKRYRHLAPSLKEEAVNRAFC